MNGPNQPAVHAHGAPEIGDDEINVFDLLQVVVENLRLLVVAPITMGFWRLA